MVRKALKHENGYDLLISVAVPYPIHWGVALSRTGSHPIARTWIADCGDPYYFNFIDSFKKPFYFKYIEKWFSRKTDFISVPRIEMKETFFKEFHDKIVAIPQGFDFSGIQVDQKSFINNAIPTFAFTGGFIKGTRDPRPLFDHLLKIRQDFKFIIYTKDDSLIKPYLKLLGAKIEVRDYVPRHVLLSELSKMDFLVNIGYDPATQSPSKLIDYALVNKPILNIQGISDSALIDEFLRGDYKNSFKVQELGKHDIKNVVNQFIDLIRD